LPDVHPIEPGADEVSNFLRRTLRWLHYWVPFTARTVFYGSVSLLLGPFTPDRRASNWAMRAWSRSGLRFLRISVDLQGLENVPAAGYAYACNHQSLLDTLVLGANLPGDFKWTVKSSLMLIPFLGWHLWLAGSVRVERDGNRRAAASAVRRFARVLAEGTPLLVFPEGTRSKDGRVKPFKMGLFYAAVRAGVPVVPVALHGTGEAMAKGAPDIGRRETRRVYVRVGEPVAPRPDGSGPERASDLRDRTHAAVVDMHRALESTGHSGS
jgi:1-acyl-sn-glycerol-3-phosphate acyltransferase